MKIREAGEFNIVSRILKSIASGGRTARLSPVGPGDDAFALPIPAGHLLAGTKDLLIENIHFKRQWARPEEIGYKSMAVNLSDLAAMGWCRPLYGLVGLALPPETDTAFIDGLYKGMRAMAGKYGLRIAGGDTVSSRGQIVISITLLGAVKQRYLITRSGARPGDLIAVTGTCGDAGAGLYLLQKNRRSRPRFARALVRKHLLPEPRFEDSKKLAVRGLATSLIDSSDGLAASVRFIAQSSGAGAVVDLEEVPISKELHELARKDTAVDPVNMALSGGEDYELCFTVKPRDIKRLGRVLPRSKVVGRIVSGKGVKYYLNGKEKNIKTSGYEHFRRFT